MTRSITGPAPAAPLPSPKERRRLREARALSEEEVARAVGVTPATVRSWEKGRTSPRGRRRAAYAKLLGCAGHPSAPHPSAPHPSVDVTRSSATSPTAPPTAPPTEPGTGPAVGIRTAPEPEPAAPEGPGLVPRARERLTSEEAFDVLYSRTAPGLTRQAFLLTGRRTLSREAVEHAFRIAWQRWPEVVRDRDPAGWVRAAAYEYAMSPWHRLRPAHRRADPLPGDPARGALLDALLGLPPSYRRTLLLHDGVGLGLPETAAETEASTPAAASRLVNARTAVVEQVPGLVESPGPGGRSVVLHERLRALALAEDVPAPPSAPAVRAGGERIAELWTRAALCFGVLLISSTAFTLHTAPTRYEQPLAPAARVGGVPPLGGPQKLTPQDLELQKSLRDELTHGPERLVPRIP
ncbi:sigma factor-like helix-turn-helix DNA-binding protein [Streptomyces atroolivaceus]|uniref:sigma factor-like helix-turn-helix DNA-binding protein n=1 Tax=Streptomyces atroolivaceus TaxID=66869 RepID=UPI0020241787|nr:sigma factor-like helix-turn-helix DNA-binding protein [Streptomyces atroolivaceus]